MSKYKVKTASGKTLSVVVKVQTHADQIFTGTKYEAVYYYKGKRLSIDKFAGLGVKYETWVRYTFLNNKAVLFNNAKKLINRRAKAL